MEIIQERLEREYNLDLITSAPTVVYHAYTKDDEMVTVDTPAKCRTVQTWPTWKSPSLGA